MSDEEVNEEDDQKKEIVYNRRDQGLIKDLKSKKAELERMGYKVSDIKINGKVI